jgi:hypothetical protein
MLNREHWKKIEALRRCLGRWFDTRSYRPLLLLFVVSMTVFLWPLAVDVAIALLFGLPNGFRKAMGQGLLLALLAVGLRRLWRVNPTDSWPSERDRDADHLHAFDARWVPWALRITVLSLAPPIVRNPHGLGFADWDFYLEYYEALRQSVLQWGQFPWWNPWSRGGFPLAAHPQISAVSIASPLVLIFGTTIGLGLSTVLCLLLAVEGAYWLARLWFGEPWAAAAAALVYGLNGGVIIHSAQGYDLAMSYWSLPWLTYGTFRLGDRFAYGLMLGVWLALVVLNGIQYLSLYSGLLMVVIWIRNLRIQNPDRRFCLLVNTLAAAGTCLLLCGWRLATVLPVLAGDLRERITYWDESPLAILHYLVARPAANWPELIPGRHHSDFVSLTSYVGPVVVLLGLVSLRYGWRWWHTLALCCTWLAIGSARWYHPSYWLRDWPFIGSAHVVTRWRYAALLGLGLAVASVLARWRGSSTRTFRTCAALLVVVIGVDFVSLAHVQLALAFSVQPDTRLFPGPAVAEIVNVRDGLGYPCMLRRYGVIRGYEPMLGYRRDAPTLRRAREDPNYQGEAWTQAGPVEPIFWSPNRIVFQLDPGQEIEVNQNPGSWWWVNGRQAFPDRRCAEMMVPFVALADENGRLELRVRPLGLEVGIGFHVVGAGLLALAWLFRGRQEQRGFVP